MPVAPSTDRLLELKIIVDAGSISQAADQLGLSRPTLSRRLNELEETVGLRLLQRTTRDLFLTPAGKELYVRADQISAAVDATWKSLGQHSEEPRGHLRISVPDSELASASIFTEFAAEFPKVELDVVITNHRTDLRAAGIDIALVFGKVNDPSLIAKSLFRSSSFPMAIPGYLEQHGTPEHPEDLSNHACIVLRDSDGLPDNKWPLASGGHATVTPRILSAGYRLMVQSVFQGLGIGLLPATMKTRNPDLVTLFDGEVHREDHLRLVYVEREYQLPHVRAFIEKSDGYWKDWLADW